jgi:hypothetical protein
MRFTIRTERLVRDTLHQFTEHHKIEVAIDDALARFAQQVLCGNRTQYAVTARRSRVRAQVGPQAGGMRK